MSTLSSEIKGMLCRCHALIALKRAYFTCLDVKQPVKAVQKRF